MGGKPGVAAGTGAAGGPSEFDERIMGALPPFAKLNEAGSIDEDLLRYKLGFARGPKNVKRDTPARYWAGIS